MTIWTIALYTGLAGLGWTFIELLFKKSGSFVISFLKNWVGAFFIFSAVVKLVDPVGFAIKLGDYFDVFRLTFLHPIAQFAAFVILVLELVVGVALLFNAYKKFIYAILIGMIVFFTVLTGVSAIFGVVQDCGCFGDFLKISPYTSFIKDLILLGVILLFVWQSKYLKPFFDRRGQFAVTAIATVAGLAFTLHNFFHLPMWDFRAYKVGTYIPDKMNEISPPVYENRFTYKNETTGEEKVFVDTFPSDSIWTFVDREQKLIDEGEPAPIHDFSFTANNGDDLTEQMLQFEKPILLIISHNIRKAKDKSATQIKTLIEASDEFSNYNYAFVTASNDAELEAWKEKHELTGTNLSADATMLKTVIRSNPGLVLLQQGTIIGKWHHGDAPSVQEITELIN